jgi:hypothetical protein
LFRRIFLPVFSQFVQHNSGDVQIQHIGQADTVHQHIGQLLGDGLPGGGILPGQAGGLLNGEPLEMLINSAASMAMDMLKFLGEWNCRQSRSSRNWRTAA